MQRDTIVIGASAGGVSALQQVVSDLRPDLPAAVLIVLHVGANKSILADLLDKAGPLPARSPGETEPLERGTVYVAPPDRHMVLEDGHVRLIHGAKENFARPAIDPLFRSAAVAYRERVVGVVLTGHMDDGSAGLRSIKECGGMALVEDPGSAFAKDMPMAALRAVHADYVLTLASIGPTLSALAGSSAPRAGSPPPDIVMRENDLVLRGTDMPRLSRIATPSPFTCPECGGGLWKMSDNEAPRFRCHTGHSFGLDTLASAQKDELERALFEAMRTLHESTQLSEKLAIQLEPYDAATAEQHRVQAVRAAAAAESLAELFKRA